MDLPDELEGLMRQLAERIEEHVSSKPVVARIDQPTPISKAETMQDRYHHTLILAATLAAIVRDFTVESDAMIDHMRSEHKMRLMGVTSYASASLHQIEDDLLEAFSNPSVMATAVAPAVMAVERTDEPMDGVRHVRNSLDIPYQQRIQADALVADEILAQDEPDMERVRAIKRMCQEAWDEWEDERNELGVGCLGDYRKGDDDYHDKEGFRVDGSASA